MYKNLKIKMQQKVYQEQILQKQSDFNFMSSLIKEVGKNLDKPTMKKIFEIKHKKNISIEEALSILKEMGAV